MSNEKPKFITIAVDFDGTIIKGGKYPNAEMEDVFQDAVYCLKKLQEHPKIRLILWSCRDKKSGENSYNNMIRLCDELGLKFDAINDNIKEYKDEGFACRKVFANIYIDDLSLSRPPVALTSNVLRNDKMIYFWKAFRNIVGTSSGLEFWILDILNSI